MDHHTGSETPMGSASSRSSITSVCFLPLREPYATDDMPPSVYHSTDNNEDEEDSSDDSSSDEELQLRCQSMLQAEPSSRRDPTLQARQTAASLQFLEGRQLVSSHANGEVLLWDLSQRQICRPDFIENRGPGWMLRRIETTTQLLYQTRDGRGTVSLHDLEAGNGVVASFETFSQTFCSVAPCTGNKHLIALPSEDETEVLIRDLRQNPKSAPVAFFPGAGIVQEGSTKHGMLTSLAFSESSSSTRDESSHSSSRPIIACGMESGTVFFHDLAMLGNPQDFKLSKDPVLALDMVPSHATATKFTPGVVAIAGMAGDAAEQQELPSEEQGTVALLKATIQEDEEVSLKARLRARMNTCRPMGDGKPGVNLCRFQPGKGRLFAVAGWDKRLRIMDRSAQASKPKSLLAILRGHSESVKALDWAPDSEQSGLLATGAGDGRIHVWRCFSRPV